MHGEGAFRVGAGVLGHQVVQRERVAADSWSVVAVTEPFLEGVGRRPEQPGDAPRRRRLRPVAAARRTTASASRSRFSSTPHSSAASHSASWASSSSVHSRNPNAPRFSTRCRLIARPASRTRPTPWPAPSPAAPRPTPQAPESPRQSSGNRASTSKNYSSKANPSRFAPDLLRSRSWSSSRPPTSPSPPKTNHFRRMRGISPVSAPGSRPPGRTGARISRVIGRTGPRVS